MSTPETALKTKVLKWLKSQDVWVYKTSDRYRSGIPDLLILKEGRLYAIELKSSVGKVSIIQEFTLRMMKKHGALTGICRSLEEVQCILN